MGICNYCVLKEIRSKAKKENSSITIRPAIDMPGENSVNIFVYPEDIELTDKNKEYYFDSWLMTLPAKCYC